MARALRCGEEGVQLDARHLNARALSNLSDAIEQLIIASFSQLRGAPVQTPRATSAAKRRLET